MRKNEPLHRIEDQAVLADDVNELLKPDTIIWAKLRGYPWWPGRVSVCACMQLLSDIIYSYD